MNEVEQVAELKTKFKRSKACRVIHADGAWGSVTPQLNVHMAIYSEHKAFPEGTTIRSNPDGTMQDTPTEDPGYLVREIEADIILSEAAATALRNWLSDRLDQIQAFRTEVLEQQQGGTE